MKLNKIYKNKRKIGFTLSEVLITLAIIGVVAAITIPIISENGQEIAFKSALKKNQSTLERALKKFELENGFRLTPNRVVEFRGLKSILLRYLNVMVDCGMGHGDQETACIANYDESVVTDQSDSDLYQTLNGGVIDLQYFDDGQFVLTDGTLVLLENTWRGSQIYISVDVNGLNKKPNKLGKDLFMFQLMNNGKLLPMGTENTDFTGEDFCSETSAEGMNGASCTVEMLRD